MVIKTIEGKNTIVTFQRLKLNVDTIGKTLEEGFQ